MTSVLLRIQSCGWSTGHQWSRGRFWPQIWTQRMRFALERVLERALFVFYWGFLLCLNVVNLMNFTRIQGSKKGWKHVRAMSSSWCAETSDSPDPESVQIISIFQVQRGEIWVPKWVIFSTFTSGLKILKKFSEENPKLQSTLFLV